SSGWPTTLATLTVPTAPSDENNTNTNTAMAPNSATPNAIATHLPQPAYQLLTSDAVVTLRIRDARSVPRDHRPTTSTSSPSVTRPPRYPRISTGTGASRLPDTS